ncbi:MAG: DUF4097 family beta strand repeat protein [Luteitalea sp.]|nr:DUF4097 family beta strand repeat protein [Luteitalea sp.]
MGSVRFDFSRLPLVATLAVSWLLVGCVVQVDSEGQVATEQARFEVDGIPEVTLSTFNGRIDVRAWDRPEVAVDVEKRGATSELLDGIQVVSDQDGSRIHVQVQRSPQGTWDFVGAPQSARVTAWVPARCRLVVRSDDGSISVEGVEGPIELRTADGSLTALKVKGDVRAHTGDGRIKIEDVEGRCDLTTGDGNVSVRGRIMDLNVRTGDGSVTVRALPGSSMRTNWNVETGDGAVVLILPASFDAELDAFTGDGRVRIAGLVPELRFDRDAEGRDRSRQSLRTRLGDGGHLLKIRTSDGSIALKSVD